MIEVHVFGSTYGESNVLVFGPRRDRRCGVIDCYPSGPTEDDNPVVQFIKYDLAQRQLEFVVATHPHDDHIRGLAQVLQAFSGRVGRLAWWGGLDKDLQVAAFHKAQSEYDRLDMESPINAKSVMSLLGEATKQGLPVDANLDGQMFHEITAWGKARHFRMRSICPRLNQRLRYATNVVDTLRGPKPMGRGHGLPNSVSQAFLIEYGSSARLIIGGDATIANWEVAFAHLGEREEGPHVVRVPHHGSRTGHHREMWSGRKYFVSNRITPTLAIITRFLQGNVLLPDATVMRQIKRAGCEGYVVGGNQPPPSGGRRRTVLSRFTAIVDHGGGVKVYPNRYDSAI